MKELYLLRHGAPLGSGTEPTRCLSRTDVPLSPQGRMQAALLGMWLKGQAQQTWCSPLSRCRETARLAFGPAQEDPMLRELDMGAWEGLSFREIRAHWPELYRARGLDPIHVIPSEGEWPEAALRRMEEAVLRIWEQTEGNAAAVTHAGVLRLLLCKAEGRPLRTLFSLSQPYGCVNRLTVQNGHLQVLGRGEKPHPALTEMRCLQLLSAAGCPEAVIVHCRKVEEVALQMTQWLSTAGYRLDAGLVQRSALLHDMARCEKNHAFEGARWLSEAGYPREAAIVAVHHDWCGGEIDEAAVVFWADKRVRGDQVVPLCERFAKSAEKCRTAEAQKAHARRARAAMELEERLTLLCGKMEGIE